MFKTKSALFTQHSGHLNYEYISQARGLGCGKRLTQIIQIRIGEINNLRTDFKNNNLI